MSVRAGRGRRDDPATSLGLESCPRRYPPACSRLADGFQVRRAAQVAGHDCSAANSVRSGGGPSNSPRTGHGCVFMI